MTSLPQPPKIRFAMVLAAGLGTRMRPITRTLPKPLVSVSGKAMIDYGLDRLAAAGVETIVVNVHYLADQVVEHVKSRPGPKIIISDERDQLLDTGGGIARALPHFGGEPFFVYNSDSTWIEGVRPNFELLGQTWMPNHMDILLMLSPTVRAVGYSGAGDFTIDALGRLSRRIEKRVAPFVYAGAAVVHPRAFEGAPDRPFSFNVLFDRAIKAGRLYGMRMDGQWLHVGTPEAIHEAELAIAESTA
jgi:MurNAc alpha-1-phosphate uridylyltransferase